MLLLNKGFIYLIAAEKFGELIESLRLTYAD